MLLLLLLPELNITSVRSAKDPSPSLPVLTGGGCSNASPCALLLSPTSCELKKGLKKAFASVSVSFKNQLLSSIDVGRETAGDGEAPVNSPAMLIFVFSLLVGVMEGRMRGVGEVWHVWLPQ